MSDLLSIYDATGRAPTLADKLRLERDLDVLNAMADALKARGHRFTENETNALATRRAELQRAKYGRKANRRNRTPKGR